MHALCLAAGLLFPVLARAAEVNLSLSASQAIPTASDSIDSYEWQAPGFADEKPDTAWVTGFDMDDHWGRIAWRNRAVAVTAITLDFTPVTFVHRPQKDFFDPKVPAPVSRTTVRPAQFEVAARLGGKWQTIHGMDEAVAWEGNKVRLTLREPLSQVTEVRIRLKTQSELVALREFSVWGPGIETSGTITPKWKAVWIWGELDPALANFSIVRRYFRGVFDIKDPSDVVSARLLFAAYDRGQAFINGSPIADLKSPGLGMRAKAEVFEIDPKLLHAGKNVLALSGEDVSGWGLRGVLAELWVQRKDGTAAVVLATGESQFSASSVTVPGWQDKPASLGGWTKPNAIAPASGAGESPFQISYTPPFQNDSARLVSFTLQPDKPKVGEKFTLSATFEAAKPLSQAYGFLASFGQAGPAFSLYLDLALGESFLPPQEGLPLGFTGQKTLKVEGTWSEGTPPVVPILLELTSPSGKARIETSLAGASRRETSPSGVELTVGAAPPSQAKAGFSDVKILKGGHLSVNGALVPPIAFSSSLQTLDRFQQYASAQAPIHRVGPHGATEVVPSLGDEEEHYKNLFALLDMEIEAVLAMDPSAYFLLYLGADLPNDWNLDHPEETIMLPNDKRIMTLDHANSMNGFLRETPNAKLGLGRLRASLGEFVKRLEAKPYASQILGLSLCSGRGAENYWGIDVNLYPDQNGNLVVPPREDYVFGDVGLGARRSFRDWLRKKYVDPTRLAEAWKVPGLKFEDLTDYGKWSNRRIRDLLMWTARSKDQFIFRDRKAEGAFYYDFVRHQNEARSEFLLEAGRAIKEASGGKLLVSGYLGYSVPAISNSPPAFAQHSGHQAMREVWDSPYVDFMHAPTVYHMRRQGDPVLPLGTVDSARLHGKLWFNEYDSRSFLSPIGEKTFSQKETLEVFQKDFGYGITKDQGWWWYEFPFSLAGAQGACWYGDEALLGDCRRMKDIYRHYLSLGDTEPSLSECAVIFDNEQPYVTDAYSPANTLGSATSNFLVPKLSKVGPSFDTYAHTDLPELVRSGWIKKYKLVIFTNAYALDASDRKLIDTELKKDGRTLVFFYAPGYLGNEAGSGSESSLGGIEEVTGLKGAAMLDEQRRIGLHFTGSGTAEDFDVQAWWGQDQKGWYGEGIGPVFYLDPAKANGWKSLASLRLDGREDAAKSALGWQKAADYQVFYSTLPDLPLSALSFMLEQSGVHFYAKPGLLSWASKRFLCVHSPTEAKNVRLEVKSPVNWIEPFEKKLYGSNTAAISVDLKRGETKFFCLEEKNEWQQFLKP